MGNTETLHLESFAVPGSHTITFNMPSEDEEIDVNFGGIKVYQTCHDLKDEFVSLMNTMALMDIHFGKHPAIPVPTIDVEEAVLEFLEESMDLVYEPRETSFVDIPVELVHSGDFIGS